MFLLHTGALLEAWPPKSVYLCVTMFQTLGGSTFRNNIYLLIPSSQLFMTFTRSLPYARHSTQHFRHSYLVLKAIL